MPLQNVTSDLFRNLMSQFYYRLEASFVLLLLLVLLLKIMLPREMHRLGIMVVKLELVNQSPASTRNTKDSLVPQVMVSSVSGHIRHSYTIPATIICSELEIADDVVCHLHMCILYVLP